MTEVNGVRLYWADEDDDADLRALVSSVVMPGSIHIRFSREPNYFHGAGIMGDPCEVLTGRDVATGEMAGLASRGTQRLFVNGECREVGYIGGVRICKDYEGRGLLAAGAKMVRERGNPDDLYFAVIASDNISALKLLAGKRPPMGIHLRPLGGVRTFSLLTRRHAVKLPPGIEIRQGNKEILAQIIAFLSECGKHQQFFPCVSAEDLTGGVRFRGLALEDIYLAYRQGQLAGVLANWDQSAFKQDIVARYSPALRTFGGVYNLFAKVIGRQPLPNIGAAIPLNFGALGCVGDNDPELFKALLQTCINAAAMKHKGYFLLSMHESDPLLLVVQRFMHIGYRSELFAYSWSAETLAALDDRLPYIEAATL